MNDIKSQLKDGKFEFSESLKGQNESGMDVPIDETPLPFCILMRKPIEKIMIRYGKIPSDFLASFQSYFTSNKGIVDAPQSLSSGTAKAAAAAQASADTLATLGRHLHHKRWLWVTQEVIRDEKSLSTVLSAITRYCTILPVVLSRF